MVILTKKPISVVVQNISRLLRRGLDTIMQFLLIFLVAIFYLIPLSAAKADVFDIVEWGGIKAIRLSGEITNESASRFNAISHLAEPAAHGFPILLLDSPGGSVMGALMLSAAMQITPVHTVIPDGASCASACASIVFIAGRYRTMEHFGRFGQHSCSSAGEPIPECNELLAQHALQHGVSHGAVSFFASHAPPEDMLWFSREDIDGWGISLYPGTEVAGFLKSEPRVTRLFTGEMPPPQQAWRLDFWKNGWRAFYRPVSDAERELQLNQFCFEDTPGVLYLSMEIHGPSEVFEQSVRFVELKTDYFSLISKNPIIWQEDTQVSIVALPIPTEHVLSWLKSVEEFEFGISMEKPYDPIIAWGNLNGSRQNLIFSANNCDYISE